MLNKMLITGAAVLALGAGGTAAAAATAATPSPVDSSGVINGCWSNADLGGSHVFVLQDAGATCPKGSTAISWNQKGATGATGAMGATGATGATGAAGPAGATGATGATGTAGAAGPAGPVGPAGAVGARGQPGTPGAPGANGNTVLNGTGPPSNSLGNDGDFYIDTAADVLYGPKSGGSWPSTGTNLVGQQGAQGPQGTPGPAGPSNLAALQRSTCTINGRTSILNVSVDPNSGVVGLTCEPLVTVSVTVSGGPLSTIELNDNSNPGFSIECGGAPSCSQLMPTGDSVEVLLGAALGQDFMFTCPGGVPMEGLGGSCRGTLTASGYSVSATVNP